MIKNEISLFEKENIKLKVNIQDETVWLTQKQMAKLFEKDRTVITKHINNVFKEKELKKKSVCANFAHTAKDGKIYKVIYYNLDVIISVGYRVKSLRGVEFRKWATSILRDYMLKGYAINQKRLDILERTVKLVEIANRVEDNITVQEAKGILNVINSYTKALDLLDAYDHKTIKKPKGVKSKIKITYEECLTLIDKLKLKEKSKLFGKEKDKGLDGIIGNIYQIINNRDVYQTVQEKISNFFYLVVKDHVFIDGNKRIAATLFIYSLDRYNLLKKEDQNIIDNKTLVALTILIAQSKTEEKNVMVNLVINFIS